MHCLSQLGDGVTLIHTDKSGEGKLISPEWILMKLYEGHSFLNEDFHLIDSTRIQLENRIIVDVSKEKIVKGTECIICRTIYNEHAMSCLKCSYETQEELVSGSSLTDKYYINN